MPSKMLRLDAWRETYFLEPRPPLAELQKLCRSGKLPAARFGKRWYVLVVSEDNLAPVPVAPTSHTETSPANPDPHPQTVNTLADFLDWFQQNIIPARNLSQATQSDYRQKLVHIRRQLGTLQTGSITVAHIADFLNPLPPFNSNRYRSFLALIFKYAIAQGKADTNPADATLPKPERVKRQRLTLEGFHAVQSRAEPWMQNAMSLALQTLQRREDLTRMKWSDIRQNTLHVIQRKVEKRGTGRVAIAIPPALQTILDACLDGVDSPYILHRQPEKRRSNRIKDHPTQLAPEQISRAFQDARDQSGFYDHLEPAERPTFHEIRALGVWMYEQKGINTDALAWGNPGTAMKSKYTSRHTQQWLRVDGVGLDII